MPYQEAITKVVHEHKSITENIIGNEKTLTVWLLKRLNATRRIALSAMPTDDAELPSVASLVVRCAVRTYSTIICYTQSKLKIFRTVFDLKDTEWLHLVGAEPLSFLVGGEGKFEESVDGLSALRRQHVASMALQRAAGSGTLSQSQRSQVGSLSQDLSSMPRTLPGDALTAQSSPPGAMPSDRISEVLDLFFSLVLSLLLARSLSASLARARSLCLFLSLPLSFFLALISLSLFLSLSSSFTRVRALFFSLFLPFPPLFLFLSLFLSLSCPLVQSHYNDFHTRTRTQDLLLGLDALNSNEAMRALVKSLFVIQEKFKMGVDGDVPPGTSSQK